MVSTVPAHFGGSPFFQQADKPTLGVLPITSLAPATDQLHFSSRLTRAAKFDPPKFGALPLYDGPYNSVRIITDFNDEISTLEAEARFWDVYHFLMETRHNQKDLPDGLSWAAWTRSPKTPGFVSVNLASNIPMGNTDYATVSLARLGLRQNNDILVHVVDPGVGNGEGAHGRSMLITENHGVYIGPNNGSLGDLVRVLLEEEGQTITANDWNPELQQYEPSFTNGKNALRPLDLDKLATLSQAALGLKHYQLPHTFHARDAFAVAAAAVLAGIDPRSITTETSMRPVVKPFSREVALPTQIDQATSFYALRDRTFGNLKTNLVLSQQDFEKLAAYQQPYQAYRVSNPQTGRGIELIAALGKHKQLQFYVRDFFGQVQPDSPLLYLGSTYFDNKLDKRRIELAINLGNAADKLGVGFDRAVPLTMTRVA